MIEQEIASGYSGVNAAAKVCQDIVLKALAVCSLNRNVTIKGGIVIPVYHKVINKVPIDSLDLSC